MIAKYFKQDISSFSIWGEIFLNKNGIINNTSGFNNVKYFTVLKDNTLFLDKNQKVLNKTEFPNIPEQYFYKLYSSSESYFILINGDSMNNETFNYTEEAIYSVSRKEIIYKSEFIGNVIVKNYAIECIEYSPEIRILDIQNYEILLKFPLTTLGVWLDGVIEKPQQVAAFSGIYENILVCNLNSGAVLLIDIQNPQNYTLLPEARFPRKMYAKAGAPHIYTGLFGRRYIEVDVTTGKMVKEVSLEAQLRQIKNIPAEQPCWFSIVFSVLYEGLYYFICETDFVGVFNPQTGIIEDYHEFDFDKKQYQQLKGGEENLQVKDGKIYCLDSLGNLYELER